MALRLWVVNTWQKGEVGRGGLRIHRLQDFDLAVAVGVALQALVEVLGGAEATDEEDCFHILPLLPYLRHLLRHQGDDPIYHWIKDLQDVLAAKISAHILVL